MCAEVLAAGEALRALCAKRGGTLMAVCLECTNMCDSPAASAASVAIADALHPLVDRPPFALPLARHLNVRVFGQSSPSLSESRATRTDGAC